MKTKQLLFAIVALICLKANAQPPTAAPTPTTHAASDVISVFSGAYTNLSGTDFFPNWGQGTVVSDYYVAGDTVKKYDMLDYEGTQFSSSINASSMSNLHVDIWTANCAAFQFYLVNTTTGAEQQVTLNPTFSGWNSYDIDLTQYSAGIVSNIGQFKFQDNPMHYHSSTTIVYLDNIYFWKSASTPTISGFSVPAKFVGDAPFNLTAPTSNSNGAFTYTSSNTNVATISGNTVTIVGLGSTIITANQAADGSFGTGSTSATLTVSFPPPATAATAPTHLSSNVVSVYSDSYTNVSGVNFYPNWGQSTTITNMTISGNATIKYDNLNYEGIEFASPLNVSSMQNLHFDIWTPNCSALDFYLINQSPQVEQKVTVNPTLSGWNSFDIPLTSYNNIDLTKIGQFKLVGNNGSTIYLDNIFFWKSASSPTITGFSVGAKNLGDAPFSLTAPTSNSTGTFTYTSSNTSVATISGSTVTIVGVGSTTITANQAGDGTYTAGSTSAILTVSYPPPPTAAPVPTRSASDVMSLFSDSYTNVSGTDWFPNWGQSTTVSDISISGNTTKRYQNLNYQGVQFASPINASTMTELHLDLWTPNCTAFDVYLINAGGVEQKVTVNPTASGWNSFDISLSQYTAINSSAIIQFKLVGTPFGTSTVYLDNIYFWKATPVTLGSFSVAAKQVGDAPFTLTAPTSNSPGAFTYTSSNTGVATISGSTVTIVGAGTTTITAMQAASGNFGSASTSASLVVTYPPLPASPTTAAATPTKPMVNVISLFSDAYSNVSGTDFFPNWGQSTQVADTMIVGNTTKKYTNLNYQGIQFAGTIDAHEATYMHVDIWTSTCTTFDVYLINTATGAEQPYSLHPTLGGWNSYDIPLSSYSASIVNHVNQIKLVGTPFGSSKVYLDNIYFWANTCINHVTDPFVSVGTNANNVCFGTSVTITATPTNGGTAPNYNFKVNGSSVQSGSSNTFTSTTLQNNDQVSCVVSRTDGCANDGTSNFVKMTIKASPAIGTSSAITLCSTSATKIITNSNTSGGGVWTSTNTAVATIATSNGATGTITPISNGTSTLTYTKTGTNGCTSSASSLLVIDVVATPNAITGTTGICPTSTTTLSSATTGGVWGTASSSIASVNASGVVTGNSAGVAVVKYTVTNPATGCSAFTSANVTVFAKPGVPTIQYAPGTVNPQVGAGGAFCVNDTFRLVGSPVGGIWNSSNSTSVSIDSTTGKVKILAAGSTNIKYTYTAPTGCFNSRTVPNVVSAVCPGHRGVANSNGQLTMDNDFTLYPNPAHSQINFNIKNLIGNGNIVVTDLYGKQVKTQPLSMGNNTVDVSALSKGFYLVSIITTEGKTTKKLVVE